MEKKVVKSSAKKAAPAEDKAEAKAVLKSAGVSDAAVKKQDMKDASHKAVEKAIKKVGMNKDAMEATITKEQFDKSVFDAAQTAATTAIRLIKGAEANADLEAKDVKNSLKEAEGIEVKKLAPAEAIKAAVKKAVIKSSGATSIADKPDDDVEFGSQITRWAKIQEKPGEFGLNAAAAAGVAIAGQYLNKAEKIRVGSPNGGTPGFSMGMMGRLGRAPSGIGSMGLLDEDDD